ncbi:class I SAM-dependent methyltransferase [Methanoculleus sp.]|uniref:class I SAM-dependent methyltransferase n=1 Tax=Methanoculleus sp. TaxID=90427 RepID=UPI00272DFA17|nr:class I SAM-dependent methyltransferase [Methanoculleus sp.]
MGLMTLFEKTDHENRQRILELVEHNPGVRLLDCGCGNGDFTRQIAEKIGTSQIFGIECISGAGPVHDGSIRVVHSDLNDRFPLDGGMFDVVHANQIIEHLYETDSFIKEIHRVLKKGGYAIISTPNLAGVHNIFSLLLGKQPFSAHISNQVILGNSFDPKHGFQHASRGEIHLRIFTYGGLVELFKYHGFTVEEVRGAGFYPFPTPVARVLARVDARHAVYLTIKVRK